MSAGSINQVGKSSIHIGPHVLLQKFEFENKSIHNKNFGILIYSNENLGLDRDDYCT